MKFSIGADPEMMVVKGDKLYSAIGIVPGTKEKRHRIGKNEFYYDNVLAECTICPSSSKAEAVYNFRAAFKSFAALVKPFKLLIQASAEYPKDQLQHPDAIAIGCTPEICAYEIQEVERPENQIANNPLRSCGGHIHIGADFCKETYNCFNTIRMLDLFLGIPSLFLDKDPTAGKRRTLYGQAGRFRQPKHGAEYRTLDNFWIASPKYVELIYDIVDFTMSFLEQGKHHELWSFDEERFNSEKAWAEENFTVASCHVCKGYNADALREAIRDSDLKKATKFIPFVREKMGNKLFDKYEEMVEEKRPTDFYKEWGIHV